MCVAPSHFELVFENFDHARYFKIPNLEESVTGWAWWTWWSGGGGETLTSQKRKLRVSCQWKNRIHLCWSGYISCVIKDAVLLKQLSIQLLWLMM